MFNDKRTIKEIKKNILLLQEETIAIKKKGEEELNAIRKDREELSKKIDERLEKLIGKTDDTNLRLNGLDKNIGYGIEEIFFDSINKTKQIGNIIYDECTQHVPIFKNLHNTNNAIDILLVNGKDVGIIEVKHRVGIKAVEQLLKTAELFKMNNNLKKYTLNLYVAGLSVHPSARKAINEHKIGFIKIRGEHFELVKNAI